MSEPNYRPEISEGNISSELPQAHIDRGDDPLRSQALDVYQLLRLLQSRPPAEHHLADLRASGLSDETIRAAGICSATADEAIALGFHSSPAMVIPYPQHAGYVRIKPDDPRLDRNGKPVKYETRRGGVNHLYIPPNSDLQIRGLGARPEQIVITEGEKKALKADQEGFVVIGVPGVWGWKSENGALLELHQVPWQGCQAIIIFDSDVTAKPDIKEATSALSAHLRARGAAVRVVVLPEVTAGGKTGLDDFLGARSAEALRQLIDESDDWFQTLLNLLQPDEDAESLEIDLRPIYRLIKNSTPCIGVLFEDRVRSVKARLHALGYASPPLNDLKKAIREVDAHKPAWASADADEESASVHQQQRFVVEGAGGRFDEQPELQGLYDTIGEKPTQLANFIFAIDRDVIVEDDIEPHRRFEGHLQILGAVHDFAIDAKDFANNANLQRTIFETAGPKAQIFCRPETLRTAISAISNPTRTRATTSFGWNDDRAAYRTPRGIITEGGFRAVDELDGIRVDLGKAEFAKRLDLKACTAPELDVVQRHVVHDFVHLHSDQHIGCTLLATTALAILYPFLDGHNRCSIWLVGLSGTGKSFFAKLAQNFFGDFPFGQANSIVSWAATVKRIQYEGYYYKDALYLVDDYKPDHVPPWEATFLLQGYADSASRSRLRRDSSPDKSREVRGQLLCTGEDIPDHSASASARLIKVPFATARKDLERGRRCLEYRQLYSGLTADFVRHIIAEQRGAAFADQVAVLQADFYEEIAGRDNDIRIAGNFAMVGAAFIESAYYLRTAWPEYQGAIEDYVTDRNSYLRRLRDEMLADVGEQKASQIFLTTLSELLRQGAIRLQSAQHLRVEIPHDQHGALVGRVIPDGEHCSVEIWTSAAREQVQESLRRQGRQQLKVTERALLSEMVEAGLLVDEHNMPITVDSETNATRPISIEGRSRRAFRIRGETLAELVGGSGAGVGGGGLGGRLGACASRNGASHAQGS